EGVMWWWSDSWLMPGMFFGHMLMVMFAIVCVAMMFLMMSGGMHNSRGGSALNILQERYARGEISQAELEERRRFLAGSSARS
ncbi:MAG: SHOCT domain-containing protein, partial [Burkholderiales bacterium]